MSSLLSVSPTFNHVQEFPYLENLSLNPTVPFTRPCLFYPPIHTHTVLSVPIANCSLPLSHPSITCVPSLWYYRISTTELTKSHGLFSVPVLHILATSDTIFNNLALEIPSSLVLVTTSTLVFCLLFIFQSFLFASCRLWGWEDICLRRAFTFGDFIYYAV